ncbi:MULTISPECIES: hypothetical protein [Bacillus]|uniref:hypothetical protein n=1 Tax=Bacillus TaxID=1386 RepID=UPI00155F09FC|nr:MULTISPECIES: hypothetical protein [Bacillus]
MLKKQEILAVYQKGPEAICDFIQVLVQINDKLNKKRGFLLESLLMPLIQTVD